MKKVVYITESEIYQKRSNERFAGKIFPMQNAQKNYNELEKRGLCCSPFTSIGQYLGVRTIEISGVHRDCVSIQYQNGDRISIPVDRFRCCPNICK